MATTSRRWPTVVATANVVTVVSAVSVVTTVTAVVAVVAVTAVTAATVDVHHVQAMANWASYEIDGFTPHWLVDTGRNGEEDVRTDCSNWCNIRGAGLGRAPTANTSLPSVVDAWFWLKTPGESDGCTQKLPDGSTCPRYELPSMAPIP
jgi:hypothetical protein